MKGRRDAHRDRLVHHGEPIAKIGLVRRTINFAILETGPPPVRAQIVPDVLVHGLGGGFRNEVFRCVAEGAISGTLDWRKAEKR